MGAYLSVVVLTRVIQIKRQGQTKRERGRDTETEKVKKKKRETERRAGVRAWREVYMTGIVIPGMIQRKREKRVERDETEREI